MQATSSLPPLASAQAAISATPRRGPTAVAAGAAGAAALLLIGTPVPTLTAATAAEPAGELLVQ